jgi:hypothetical protein
MWRKVRKSEEDSYLAKAIEFTGDHALYGRWMRKVIPAWPIACEHNLTDLSQNRRAWIGHAATQLAIDCPEYVTRMAWGHLTEQQRRDANRQADLAIELWESQYVDNSWGQLCLSFTSV